MKTKMFFGGLKVAAIGALLTFGPSSFAQDAKKAEPAVKTVRIGLIVADTEVEMAADRLHRGAGAKCTLRKNDTVQFVNIVSVAGAERVIVQQELRPAARLPSTARCNTGAVVYFTPAAWDAAEKAQIAAAAQKALKGGAKKYGEKK